MFLVHKDKMEHKYCNNIPPSQFGEVVEMLSQMEHDGGFNENTVKKYPVTAAALSLEMVDRVVSVIRLQKTNECYFTNGSMSDDENLLDVSQIIGWTIKKPHRLLLAKICEQFKCPTECDNLMRVDQSLRLKRSKGSSWVYFVNTSIPQKAMTYDVSFRTSLEEDIANHIPIFLTPTRSCAVCQKCAMSCCGRCKVLWYCTVTCQREHWKLHKQSCKFLIK